MDPLLLHPTDNDSSIIDIDTVSPMGDDEVYISIFPSESKKFRIDIGEFLPRAFIDGDILSYHERVPIQLITMCATDESLDVYKERDIYIPEGPEIDFISNSGYYHQARIYGDIFGFYGMDRICISGIIVILVPINKNLRGLLS